MYQNASSRPLDFVRLLAGVLSPNPPETADLLATPVGRSLSLDRTCLSHTARLTLYAADIVAAAIQANSLTGTSVAGEPDQARELWRETARPATLPLEGADAALRSHLPFGLFDQDHPVRLDIDEDLLSTAGPQHSDFVHDRRGSDAELQLNTVHGQIAGAGSYLLDLTHEPACV